MKKTILTTLSLVIIAMTLQAQQLFVASYNIRYQNEWDTRDGNGWVKRCPVVCGQLNFEHPDIFGTQEVLKSQIDDMLQLLTDYDYIGRGRDDGQSAGEHAAIFYNRKRLQLKEHGDFWLSETPDVPGLGWDAACTRICTWGKFRDRQSRRTFYFFNLHMDHVGTVARREGAKLVVERIRQIAKGKPVILTGDFNVDQNNEVYSIFSKSGLLNDSYVYAQQRFAENGTFNAYNSELKTESRIDHVFVSPSFSVERYGVLTNCYWEEGEHSDELGKGKDAPQEINFAKYVRRLPSDHYPVFVHLRGEK